MRGGTHVVRADIAAYLQAVVDLNAYARLICMRIMQRIASGVIAVALAITFVAAGFAVCTLPFVTHALSSSFSRDDVSPFDRAQLTVAAEAMRDFSFGAHDELALYQTVFGLNAEYRDAHADALAGDLVGFPKLDAVSNTSDLDQLKGVFAHASELYCLSPAAVAHLDDCYALVASARPALVVAFVVAVAGVVFVGKAWGRRVLGAVLLAAGSVVLGAFMVLGAWALVDFNGFFTSFHQLFFSQGNWQFPYDSLMICALPTEFWMGMGGVWLATSFLCAVASVVGGCLLRRKS